MYPGEPPTLGDVLDALLDPPVRWVHLVSAVLWPASALIGLWRTRSLRRRRSRRITYALVVVAFAVGAENLMQALSKAHPAGWAHLTANIVLSGAGVIAVFAMAAYGTEVVVEERILHALSRGPDADEPPEPRDPLTPREWEVLGLLCQGLGSEPIAARLGISPNTADTHIRNLMRKLKVSSRASAVGWAVRSGAFDPSTGRLGSGVG